jgi:hypothetical protein
MQCSSFSDFVSQQLLNSLRDEHSLRNHEVKHPVRLCGVVRNLLCFQYEDHTASLPLTIEAVTLLQEGTLRGTG